MRGAVGVAGTRHEARRAWARESGMGFRSVTWVATGLFLVGCNNVVAAISVPTSSVSGGQRGGAPGSPAGKGRLQVETIILDGGLFTQALVEPFTRRSIHHLVVRLFRLNENAQQPTVDDQVSPISRDVSQSDLAKVLTFDELSARTRYRIRADAYKAPGIAEGDLISVPGVDSQVDVILADDDRPTLATLKVRLIDVPFLGVATASGIVVTDGGYASPAPERIL